MLVMHVTDILLWRADTDSPAKPVLPGAVRHLDKGCEVDDDGVILLPVPAKCVVVRGVVTLYALPLGKGLDGAATDPPTALEYCDVLMDEAEDKIIASRSGIF
ncbi:hypothetical protein CVT25_009290 [Psilocybe cyanescens]|uniref:Uncharacterized protein n=1 Tax=Psilocybe cyanescens TaxID=93625 RepID=A0A409WWF3_PSICY|nr:hypothetical protein CVT25_009290 [Psilocybe cyanescens]